jgi:putative acyl-CoA dehydrogenase
MRAALTLALHHCAHRSAFGRRLLEQPLMKNVLADLALESEAATVLALRLAATIDRSEQPDHPERAHEAALRRVLTPIAKFWVCKRGSHYGQEAMECLGGNGYVEEDGEGVMARIYRELPLNSIWEGAANIMALDLLRALRSADAAPALARELAAARGVHPAFDRLAAALPARIDGAVDESGARVLARDVGLLMQAALLARTAPPAVAEAWCRARLAAASDVYGTLPPDLPFDALIARAQGA